MDNECACLMTLLYHTLPQGNIVVTKADDFAILDGNALLAEYTIERIKVGTEKFKTIG
ncbi:hypothetical protein [Segatella oris]|uniref:hypothetical protein n=1 Tax=Segatella oris TaxID=28135 RepID=UPI0028E83C7D|nr:hypothetical protein [Segatella oris]